MRRAYQECVWNVSACSECRQQEIAYLQVLYLSPLMDSNRRPPLSMKKGRASSDRWCIAQSWRVGLVAVVASWAHLSIASSLGGQGRLEFAAVAHLLKDRQAARGSVAPAGAKGSLRVSMCQIASDSRRARSTWATLAPRCLPIRALVCW